MGSGDNVPRQVWDRSSPPPVAEIGERSVGNRKERLRDYANFPDRQPKKSTGNPKDCGHIFLSNKNLGGYNYG